MSSAALRVVEAHAQAYRTYWRASMVTTLVTPILFLLAMGVGLGTLVARNQAELPAGLTYLEFLAPGMLAATAMQVAVGEATWPVRMGMRWQKTYYATIATPVRPREILFGNLLWLAVRVALASLAFVLVMAAFGVGTVVGGFLSVFPAVLVGVAFGAPLSVFAATAENDAAIPGLYRFGILPLFLFSGTFFPISQLPDALEPLAFLTPLWHGVELCRALAVGTDLALPAAVHVGYLAVWVLAGGALAAKTFERRLAR